MILMLKYFEFKVLLVVVFLLVLVVIWFVSDFGWLLLFYLLWFLGFVIFVVGGIVGIVGVVVFRKYCIIVNFYSI